MLVIQIDGIHMDDDLILVAALGVDAKGDKHPLGLTEGATENAATVQALIDNLVERGLDPTVPRLFIIDGAKALTKAIRRTFGAAAAIQQRILLKADVSEAGKGWSDNRIIEALETSPSMVYRTRKQLVEEGFEAVLHSSVDM